MKCPRCGTKLKNEKNPFCMRCGYIKNDLDNKYIKKHFQPNEKIIIPIFLTGIIITLIMFIVNDQNDRIKNIKTLRRNIESTSLYTTNNIAYNNILSPIEQEAYNTIIKAINNYENKTKVVLDNYDRIFKVENGIRKVLDAIDIDHPELIQYAYSDYRCKIDSCDITINYAISKNEYSFYFEQLKNKIEKIKNDIKDFSDYKKALHIYSVLGQNQEYGNKKDNKSYSIICFVDDNYFPLDKAYSKMSQIIFQNVGIESIIVSGKLGKVKHNWNLIELDNSYYSFDLSWCSSKTEPIKNNISYYGFLFRNPVDFKYNYKIITPHAWGLKYFK